MIDEAQSIVTTIRQMEESLDDAKPRREYHEEHDDLQITFPLNECIQVLKEKHHHISKLHRERFAQVESRLRSMAWPPCHGRLTQCRACNRPRVVLVAPRTFIRQDCAPADRTRPVDPPRL